MKLIFKTFLFCILTTNFNFIAVAEDKETPAPIKIGVIYGFTGAAQIWSEFGRMGLELAQDEINNSGGINGRKIELIYEDSKTIPAQSVSAYHKLVTIDKVNIIIGNLWAFITNPLIPLAQKDHVVILSPTVMPESVEQTNDHFFTMGARVSSISEAVNLFFEKNKEIKTLGIFCWDDPWGQAYLKIWKEAAEKNGIKIEAALCSHDFSSDFRTDVAKIAAKKVDAVIIAHMGEVILKRMKEQSFSAKVLTTGNLVEEIKIKKAPKELFEGIYLTDWKPSEAFIEKFKAKFGKEPVLEAHNSYEALHSLAKALLTKEPDILSALSKVKYSGVTGDIDFTKSSFANYSIANLYRVQNGEFESVK